ILRGYLGAYAVGLLKFDGAEAWKTIIEAETDKDLSSILLEEQPVPVPAEKAKASAKIVATAIMTTKLRSLEMHSLDEIQNWRNKDETLVANLRPLLRSTSALPRE